MKLGPAQLNIPVERALCILFLFMTAVVGYAPYQADSTLGVPAVQTLLRLTMYLCAGAAAGLLLWRSSAVRPKVVAPVVWWLTVHLHTYVPVAWDALNLVLLVSLLLLEDGLLAELFRCYRGFLLVMAAAGVLCYAAYALDLPIPYDVVKYYNRNDLYINYQVSFLYTDWSGNVLRLCGLFNEPGYFGTVLALVLCADGIDLRRKGNWLLLLAGCLTVSAAFFVLLFLGLLLVHGRKPWAPFVFGGFLLFWLFVLPGLEFSDPNVAGIVDRLRLVDGRLAGDNRVDSAVEAAFGRWLESGRLLLGYGSGYSAMNGSALSYKTYLMDFGIIGFLLIYGPLLAAAWQEAKGDRRALPLVACFFVSIYQRTGVYCLPYFLILFGGIQWARQGRAGDPHG